MWKTNKSSGKPAASSSEAITSTTVGAKSKGKSTKKDSSSNSKVQIVATDDQTSDWQRSASKSYKKDQEGEYDKIVEEDDQFLVRDESPSTKPFKRGKGKEASEHSKSEFEKSDNDEHEDSDISGLTDNYNNQQEEEMLDQSEVDEGEANRENEDAEPETNNSSQFMMIEYAAGSVGTKSATVIPKRPTKSLATGPGFNKFNKKIYEQCNFDEDEIVEALNDLRLNPKMLIVFMQQQLPPKVHPKLSRTMNKHILVQRLYGSVENERASKRKKDEGVTRGNSIKCFPHNYLRKESQSRWFEIQYQWRFDDYVPVKANQCYRMDMLLTNPLSGLSSWIRRKYGHGHQFREQWFSHEPVMTQSELAECIAHNELADQRESDNLREERTLQQNCAGRGSNAAIAEFAARNNYYASTATSTGGTGSTYFGAAWCDCCNCKRILCVSGTGDDQHGTNPG